MGGGNTDGALVVREVSRSPRALTLSLCITEKRKVLLIAKEG